MCPCPCQARVAPPALSTAEQESPVLLFLPDMSPCPLPNWRFPTAWEAHNVCRVLSLALDNGAHSEGPTSVPTALRSILGANTGRNLR